MKTHQIECKYLPYLVAVNITQRCDMKCSHCYMDAGNSDTGNGGELSCDQLAPVMADIGNHAPGTIMVLTGGEPLCHPEIEEMVASGVQAGLRVVIGTGGTLLSKDQIVRFKNMGLSGIGISIDSVDAAHHNSFRGAPGSHERACEAIRMCAKYGLHAQMHFAVTRASAGQIEEAVDLAKRLGARILNFFFLVCVGRGRYEVDLDAKSYEEALRRIAALEKRSNGIMVQARCAPHFKRILYERNPESDFTRAKEYDGGGCIAGTHYCRIDNNGNVTPCPYMTNLAGNIHEQSFWEIWQHSSLLNSMRKPVLQGRCAVCEYRLLCGGCRARSVAESRGLFGDDPSCSYEPRGGPIITPEHRAHADEVVWTAGAKKRLERIPIFLRKMVKGKLEAKALINSMVVTEELMQQHKAEREKELGIKFK